MSSGSSTPRFSPASTPQNKWTLLSQVDDFLCSPVDNPADSVIEEMAADSLVQKIRAPQDEEKENTEMSDTMNDNTEKKDFITNKDSQGSVDSQDINGNIFKSAGRRKASKPVKISFDSPIKQLIVRNSEVSSHDMETREKEMMTTSSQNSVLFWRDVFNSEPTKEETPEPMSILESTMESTSTVMTQIQSQLNTENSIPTEESQMETSATESQIAQAENTENSMQLSASQMLLTPVKQTSTQDPLCRTPKYPWLGKTPNPFTPFSAAGSPFTPIEITPIIRMINEAITNTPGNGLTQDNSMDSPSVNSWRSSQRHMNAESPRPSNGMVTPSMNRPVESQSQETPTDSLPLSQQRNLVS